MVHWDEARYPHSTAIHLIADCDPVYLRKTKYFIFEKRKEIDFIKIENYFDEFEYQPNKIC